MLKQLGFLPTKNRIKYFTFWDSFNVRENGKGFKIVNNGSIIETELFWEGLENGWEKETVSLWKLLCGRSEVIFDIGANTGIFSVLAKFYNPNAAVYAFEPMERVSKILKENARINDFAINVHTLALSNQDGRSILYDSNLDNHYSVSLVKSEKRKDKIIEREIETQRLETFIEKNRISKIDLIKLDVERHEAEVMEGMAKYLFAMKPDIIIEILDDDIGRRIEEYVRECGYHYYLIDGVRTLRKVNTLSKGMALNYFLCRPETTKWLIRNANIKIT